ncbi:2-hydroxyacid dehydrogenase [Glycomyces terrestris]|uniref:Phosphoglycerate dehydrogenase n=1 Tax=Glycomyces terrestris TaxID=2493553 RepID=A0A426USZ5_9ACTN|nr:2-hydroxyacid dehydrogenase [Glycomyces terrestris]RRR96831.1 phosphoglycerate dehydrogenase [Glycomyces terrestris]
MKVWIPHEDGLAHLGPLPDGVDVEIYEGGAYPSDPAGVELLVPPGGVPPERVFAELPGLRAVQLLSAGAEQWVPHVPEGIALCDNKGAHTEATAEWIQTATLASIRRFDAFARRQSAREWAPARTTTLTGATALIVGAGSIGESVARRFAASRTEVLKIARTARPGVHTLDDLPDLLPKADVVVIIVPLTPETERLVDAAFLARMKDGALLVNAARGRVVDTEALTREVAAGRLRCALDVTEPEPLPADHELWGLEGALITPHVGGAVEGFIERVYPLVGDQIRRLDAGEPLANTTEHGY